jgi:hypothetical protein
MQNQPQEYGEPIDVGEITLSEGFMHFKNISWSFKIAVFEPRYQSPGIF